MKTRTFITISIIVVLLAGFSSTASARAPSDTNPSPTPLAFHPVNSDYWRIKADLDATAPRGGGNAPALSSANPVPFISWQGQGANGSSPSDATGAIGPDRYIETVNTRVGVYDRTGALLSENTQAAWTGISNASGDAVIMWSPHDNRYYASMVYIKGVLLVKYKLIFGFSKGPTPSANNSDWCFYVSDFGGRYGSKIPDYPKLGDTSDFMLIGVNAFNNLGTTFLGADVAWVSKPAAGVIVTCPALSSLKTGVKTNLKNADGTQAATPNPAKQTDSYKIGVVVANEDPGSGTSTVLTVYTVKNVSGNAVFSAPHKVTVPTYSYPPSAPQQGTNDVLDTLDARLMSAWMAPDPSHGGAFALWTGHTVAASGNGLGAEFRWYEINSSFTLYQNGVVNDPNLYVFMGAVSPDRNGTNGTFGSNALMAFNTSSSNTLPAAAMASVVGGVQSGIVTVATSPAPDTDFTCRFPYGPPCRWGDYAGASPDPASTNTGQVWMSVMMNGPSGNPSWTTENWGAVP